MEESKNSPTSTTQKPQKSQTQKSDPSSQTSKIVSSTMSSPPASLNKDIRIVVRNAILSSTVLLFVIASSIIMYFNLISIAPYINSIIWGILISIPLHFLKRQLLTMLMDSSGTNAITEGTLRALVWSFIKRGFKMICEPILYIYRQWCPEFLQERIKRKSEQAKSAGKVSGHSAKIRVSAIYNQFSSMPSAPYFGALFSAASWWLIFKTLTMIPFSCWMLIILCFILFVSLKVVRQAVGSFWRSIRKRVFILKSSTEAASPNDDKKQEIEKKLHSQLASFLVFGSAFVFYSLVILTFFQTVFHTQRVVSSGVSTLMSGDQFDTIRASANEYAQIAATWLDTQVNERFPGSNFSAASLLLLADDISKNGSSDPLASSFEQVNILLKNYDMPITASMFEYYFLGTNSTFSYGDMAKEWKNIIENLWDTISKNPNADWVKEASSKAAGIAASVGGRILSILVSGAGFFSHCAVTASIAHTFVTRQSSILEDCGDLFNASIDADGILQSSVEASLNAIFAKMAKTFAWHSIFTWLSFEILGVPFSLAAGAISGIITILPVASSFSLIIVPFGIGYLGVAERSIIKAVLLIGVHFFFADSVHSLIYQDILVYSATYGQVLPSERIAGISVALGVIAFGAKGIVFGPLLACAPNIILAMYRSMLMLDTRKSMSS